MPLLLAAWCAGVFCFLARLSFGLFAAHRLRAGGTAVAADLQRFFDDLCERTGITRAVRLLNSAHVEVPTVVGWLRPAVLLPASCLTGLAPGQIEAILCHELAHIRRHDYLVSVLQSVVETLLFYHPAVWWVSKQIRRERECCCDEFAVSAGGDVLAYVRALSFLEEHRAVLPQLALGANGGVLKMRIQRLLGRPESSATSQIASIAVLILITLSALTFTARHVWAEVRSSHPASSATTGNATAPSSAKPPSDADAVEAQGIGADLDQIRKVQSQQAGLQARLEEIKDGQAKYSALLAQAGQQPQLSDEDRNRLEDAASRLTDSLEAWVDQLQRQIDSSNAEMDHFNSPEFQKQMADATARIDASEFKRRLAEVQAQVKMLNSADFHQQTAEAQASLAQLKANQKQMQAATAAMGKIDAAQLRKHVEAERAAMTKLNSPEFRRQMEQAANAQAQLSTSEKRLQAAVKSQQLNATEMRQRLQQQATQAQLLASNLHPSAIEVPSTASSSEPQDPSGPVRVSSGVMAGAIISQPPPTYPDIAKAAHVQGVVVLHAIISKDGTVEKLTVVSGPPMLVQNAVDAVQKWTYHPYMINGQPVEVETTINVNYTFGGPDLSCTYYDRGQQHAGTCEEDSANKGQYSCRADDDKGLVQSQSSCEWKVKRLQESQHGASLSTGDTSSITWTAAPSLRISPATDRAGETVRRIGGNVIAPAVIYQAEPEFTEEARAAKASGKVLVGLIVNAAGLPESVHAVNSHFVAKDESKLASITTGMTEKAIEAVQQYHFRPAMENGKPVPVSLNVEVNFQVF
jgi:TonB family protein